MVISNRIVRLLATGALAFSAPALAACSTDMPTDKVYNQAVGTNERHASSIDVLNAMIVSNESGTGTFITTLVNNDNKVTGEDSKQRLTGLSVKVPDPATDNPDDFAVVEIDVPRGLEIVAGENLVLSERGEGGIKIEGEFPDDTIEPGYYAEVTLTFDNAPAVTLEVPVVTNCGYHEGEDGEPDAEHCDPPTEGVTHEDEAH